MHLQIKRPLLILGAIAGLAVTAVFAWQAAATSPEALYPPAPFSRVDADFPRILATRERPIPSDEAAVQVYALELKTASRFLQVEGAAAHATQQERDALSATRSGEYAKAREIAHRVLKADPLSIPGLMTLASVEAYGDGNLPRGLFLIRKARAQCERLGRENANDPDARQWYLMVLEREYGILDGLDRSAEQLVLVDRIEAVYQPMPHLRIWRLIKLRRYDEAAEAIRQTEAQGGWTLTALNCRCALASEMQDRGASFEAGAKMVAYCDNSPVLWSNYGSASLEVFRFDEAEKGYLKSVSLGESNFLGTSYNYLNILYLQQGRVAEAVDALKQAKRQRALRQPYTLQQDEATSQMGKAMLMLVLGRDSDAVRYAKSAYDLPDRGGSKSAEAEVFKLATALGYAATLHSRAAELAETGDATSGAEYEAWMIDRATRTLTGQKLLVGSLRPYLSGGPDSSNGVPSWLRISIVRLFPAGVAAEAVRQARQVEDHPAAIPYLDAADAEVHLLMGDYAGAIELAREALAGLSAEGEKLLRARVALVAAQAASALGDLSVALPYFETALRDFPAAFRLLNSALPVRFEPDSQPTSTQLAEKLAKSPRFVNNEQGFRLIVESREQTVSARVLRADGTQLARAMVEWDPAAMEKSQDEAMAKIIAELHQQLLSPAIDLTQSDLSSLDGSPFAARTHDMIDRLLEPARPK